MQRVLRPEEQLFPRVPRPQDGAVGLSLEDASALWCIQTGGDLCI